MWKMQLALDTELAATSDAGRGRAPLADAVKGQHQRLGKRRGVIGRSCMADVVFGKQEALTPVHIRGDCLELAAKQIFLEQFLLDPDRHRLLDRKSVV